jgi:predicted enzyme related to lactoylglutathione lyase
MANAVAWFEVAGKDQPALKEFYGELFGWTYTDSEGMPYSMVEADGGIPGGIGAAPEGHPGHVTFYVAVDELEPAIEKAESLGGSKVMGPMDIPGGGRIAHFSDPEGHVIGLLQPGEGM